MKPPSRVTFALGLLVGALGCQKEPPAPASAPKAGLGNVMAEVARRFELTGRAVTAQRYELADYEANELVELFESDVPEAELPKEGPTAHIPAMAKAFLATNAAELKKATATKDRPTIETAFAHTAAACNACHAASAKGFIEVPSELGKPVPTIDAVPAR